MSEKLSHQTVVIFHVWITFQCVYFNYFKRALLPQKMNNSTIYNFNHKRVSRMATAVYTNRSRNTIFSIDILLSVHPCVWMLLHTLKLTKWINTPYKIIKRRELKKVPSPIEKISKANLETM